MGKKLTDSRKMANILIISCKSHHLHWDPIYTPLLLNMNFRMVAIM